ncbi:dockerin type I domain-containing protein [Aeoliella sp.]|uniref:dockerin type I domain-containing protein n=1 Tax=Aeoliella sp. TaxID=2795800 RepID=UPI003CCBB9CF
MASCSLIWQRVLAFLLALVLSGATLAVDFTWNSSVALGEFDDPNSWFPSTTAPTVGDTVTFEDSANANFAVDGAVDSITVDQNVGFVFQSDSGVRTLAVDDVFLEDSASLLLDEVRLALSGSVIGMGVEDAKLELLEEARVTGGVIDGVHVLLSDATALLDGVELRNSLVSRTQTVDPSILNNVSIGPNVTLGGNSGTMLQLEGTTTLVGDSELTIAPSLVAILDGQLMGAGDSHLITNFGELWTASLGSLTIGFDDSPGVSQSLTIDNTTGVLNINSLSSFVVDEGELVIRGGLIEGGGNLRADGADLVVSDAAVIDSVSILANNGASLSLGVGVTLQSVDVEVRNGSTSDIPSGFAIGAGSAYRSTSGGVVTIGPAVANDGSLRAERATLRVVGDTTIDGAGTTTLASAGTLGVAPRIELAGGGSLTVGADQTLLFDTPGDGYLYGTGSGGLTLVNNGLLQVGVNGQATVLQSDNVASPIAAATLQDFTLENRGELLLVGGSRLTLLNDSSTASTPVTTIDNVGGVITLSPSAELVFDQPNFTSTVVLQGGLITGGGAVRSSGGDLLINGGAVIDGSTIAVENGAALTLDAGVTLQSADIAIGQFSSYALPDGFVVDAGMTYRSYQGGLLTIDGDVTNNGVLRADGATLRFLGDVTLNGTGVTEAVTDAGNGPPFVELSGGGSLTVGVDQSLLFDSPNINFLSGAGAGGVTLINDGLVQVGVFDTLYVVQSDVSALDNATLQDFTLVNNGELLLESDARLVFFAEVDDHLTPVATTIDNRQGVITLEVASEISFQQAGFPIDVTLRGGQIVGSSTEFVSLQEVVVTEDASLRLTDSPTFTDITLRVEPGATLTIDGDVTNNGVLRADGAMLRFLGDVTLNGTGVTEVGTDGNLPPFVELSGGGSLTVGVDQSLLFESPNINFLYGAGSGGVTLINDGLVQVGVFDTLYVVQSDVSALDNATLQDFTLVNNGELLLESDARLVFFAEVDDHLTPVATTIDNRQGVITLEVASEISFQQAGFPIDVTLRGGQIVGSSTEFVSLQEVVVTEDASLRLTDSPTFTDITLRVEPGATLTIDGDLTNNGFVRIQRSTLRVLGDSTFNGSGTTELTMGSGTAAPRIEIGGGGSLTVGADQTLLFDQFLESFVYGSGSGGVTLVNDGLTQLGQFATVTFVQSDTDFPVPGATLQDFTLVNNGELILGSDSQLVFRTHDVDELTPVATTIDNRNGVIRLEVASEMRFEHFADLAEATLRGGQIVGSNTEFVPPEEVVVDEDASLRLSDSPTFTDVALRVRNDGILTIDGPFTTNANALFTGGRLNAIGGEWLGTGEVVFEEAGPFAPAQIVSGTSAAMRFGSGQQVRITGGVTELSGATIAGSTTDGAGSLTIESGATLRVVTTAAGIEDVAFQVSGVLNAQADLTAAVPIPVATGGELRVDAGATVTAPSVTIDPGGVLTLAGGVLDTPSFVLDGSAVGSGTIVTPNNPATPTHITSPITGTSTAEPITLTGWIEGDGLLDNVLFEGTHSPGSGTEFTTAGSLAYGPNADLRIEITNQNVLNPGFDRLVSTGSVVLGGDLDLQLVDYIENTLNINDQLVLLTSSGLSGQFANVAPGDRVLFDGGLASAQIDYGPTSPFNPDHVVFSEFVREPQQIFWIGGNSVWGSPINWDLLRVPNNDGALIFHAVVNSGNVDVNVPVTLSGLTLNNSGGTLTLNQTMTVEDLYWTAGHLGGPNALTITGESRFETTQQVNTGPGLINQGTATWVDGDLNGTFNQQGFVNEGEFLIELVDDHDFRYVTNTATGVIRHTGTARAWLGGNTGFENDGLVEITGGGTMRVGRDFNNGSDGDFVITDGVLESSIGFGVDHKFNGSITGQEYRSVTGTISFNGAYDIDTTTVSAGSVTFNTAAPATSDTLTISSGELKVETMLFVDDLEWNGGGFATAAGETVLTTSAVIDTSAQKTLSGRFVNQGEAIWRDGDFSQSFVGLFQNEGTLLIELAAERSMYHSFNTSTGVIRHTTSARAIFGPTFGFENDGLVEITGGGTLRVGRDRNNGSDGDFVITDGVLESSIGFGVDHKFNGSVTGQEFRSVTGTISFNGTYDVDTTRIDAGVVTLNTTTPATTDTLILTTGDVAVESILTVDQLEWNGGGFATAAGETVLTTSAVIDTSAQKTLSGRFVNQGEAIWRDGDFSQSFVGLFQNEGTLLIELAAERSMYHSFNTSTGVIRHTTSARAIFGPTFGFENDGLVEITGGGTLRVARDRNNGSDGDFVITNGVLESSVGFGADHKFNGSVTGQEFRASAGTISFNGAYDVDTTSVTNSVVTFNTATPATTSMLTINSGNIAVETTLEVDQLTWNGGGFVTSGGETVLTTSAVVDTSAGKTLTGRFVNQGEVIWRDGNFSQSSQGLFRNEGTLLIELAAERSLYHLYNTTTGVVRHTSSAVAILGPTAGFENDGLVEITGGGTLRVARDRNNGSDGDFVITNGVLESSVGFGADHKYNGSITGQDFRSVTGTTSFNGAYDVNTTTINGGVVTFNTPSPATTDSLTINAGEVKVETEFAFDEITWTGGGFGNAVGQPILTGQGVISGPAAKAVATTLVNQGELTWNDGNVGSGSVTAARLRNEGLFTMDLVTPRNIVRLENPGGGVIENTGANATINWFANYGTLDVIASTVTVGGNFDNHSGTTLTGGEWIVRDGAAINMGARTVTINNAAVRLFGPGSTLAAIDPLADNRGVFEIAEGRDFTTVGDFTNSGDVVIGQGSTFTVTGTFTQTGNDSSLQVDGEFLSPGGPATFADGAALGGGGFVPGEVVIGTDGVVTPGSSPGTLTVDSLELSNGAIYEWEFDGVEADSVVANQQLTLGTTATLRIVQLGGAPATSDEFVLFAYPDTQIDPSNPVWTIDGSLAPDWDTSSATVTINAVDNQILLTGIEIAFNPADFNNDGAVNLVDYTVWRNSLGSTVAPFTFADGDGDGTVSVADYTVWKSNFGTIGVGSLFASSSAVPEPCTVALLIVSCLAASAQRRWFVPR